MSAILLGEYEKRELDKHADRILRDLGYPPPPLRLPDVRALLSLSLKYYRHSDPGLVTELEHRFRLLVGKTIPDIGKHLQAALSKSKFCGFWVPDGAQILIDSEVPELKHRWIEAHEITHSIAPWHQRFLFGDNERTLDPVCHATLEAEANYGAGRLLFLQDQFSTEARDLPIAMESVKSLAKRYGNSIQSTFWRFVEDRDAAHPAFGVVSTHPHHANIGNHEGPHPWRYFIRSAAFVTQFGAVTPEQIFDLIRRHASWLKTGPIFAVTDVFADVRGDAWESYIESFSTGYALLTFGFLIRRKPTLVRGR